MLWICDFCGKPYSNESEVALCEGHHIAVQEFKDGKLNEVGLAQRLGFDVSTPQAQENAVKNIQNMFTGGSDYLLGDKTPGVFKPHLNVSGRFIGTTKVHGNGKAQIPFDIRVALGLKDEDFIFWYEFDGRYYISPSEEMRPWVKGKTYFSGKG